MKTHWKKLTNPDYLGAYSLGDKKEEVIKILSVSKEMVKGTGGTSQECIVAKVHNNKPMILNKTNCKIIQKMTGTPFIEDWKGLSVTIYVAQVSAFGDVVDALRVRSKLPVIQKPTIANERFEKALIMIKAGNEQVKKDLAKFSLTPEQASKLKENATAKSA